MRELREPYPKNRIYAGGMDLSDASSHIVVIVHPAPAEWWQNFAGFWPLVFVLAVAPFAVWYLFRRKPEDWSRIQWALDVALDDRPEKRHAGLAVLDQLSSGRSLRRMDAEGVAKAKAILRKPHS